MPQKIKLPFKIHPESISSDKFINGLKDGSIFSYYNNEYYLNYKKIVPWELYNVNKYVPTKEDVIQYEEGGMWFREKGKWIYIGPFIVSSDPGVPIPPVNCGIGCMIIEDNFTVT